MVKKVSKDYDEFEEAMAAPNVAKPTKAPSKEEKPSKIIERKLPKRSQGKNVTSTSTPAKAKANAIEVVQHKLVTSTKPRRLLTASFDDKRNLTNKGKEVLRKMWSADRSSSSRDSLIQGMVDSAKTKFGATRVFATREELGSLVIGIPVPSLALEWLWGNNVFPLSVVIMLAGLWGTCKSALLYEFFRWVYEMNGLPYHIDTEDKFDPDFACDVMRSSRTSVPFVSQKANSLEQMQQMLTHGLSLAQKMLIGNKEQPGPGKTLPCLFAIDSIAAATSVELQEKILTEGNASRSHPVNALYNTGYLNGIKKQFEGWPFTLVIVNHLKTKKDDNGNDQEYTLGGTNMKFHESFELRNTVWKSKFSNSQFEGIGVRIACVKNSFGPTGRKIRTRFLWYIEDDPETGEPRDRFVWDWNWALCTLLNEMDGLYKNRLKERGLTIEVKSASADIDCLANFKALGMGKNEYLPFQEVGQMIQDNPEICEGIRDALNIKRRYILNRPYDVLEKEFKKKLRSKE